MTTFILADNQDISRLGLEKICSCIADSQIRRVCNKKELLLELQAEGDAVVITDYTLFDFSDLAELIVIHQRFPDVPWILFSEELSYDFVHRITAEGTAFSIVSKSCKSGEIDQAIHLALRRERFICHVVMEQILSLPTNQMHGKISLTPTEIEILKEIALGRTTKEIAADRNSSFHTINTHRKNIFRKLDVNTAYEAIRYALRAGLIDQAEYYI